MNQGGIIVHNELEARVKFQETTTAKGGFTKDMVNRAVVFK
jgi:hypothetical protein